MRVKMEEMVRGRGPGRGRADLGRLPELPRGHTLLLCTTPHPRLQYLSQETQRTNTCASETFLLQTDIHLAPTEIAACSDEHTASYFLGT